MMRADGRCSYHPSIQLCVLPPHGPIKILLKECPLCILSRPDPDVNDNQSNDAVPSERREHHRQSSRGSSRGNSSRSRRSHRSKSRDGRHRSKSRSSKRRDNEDTISDRGSDWYHRRSKSLSKSRDGRHRSKSRSRRNSSRDGHRSHRSKSRSKRGEECIIKPGTFIAVGKNKSDESTVSLLESDAMLSNQMQRQQKQLKKSNDNARLSILRNKVQLKVPLSNSSNSSFSQGNTSATASSSASTSSPVLVYHPPSNTNADDDTVQICNARSNFKNSTYYDEDKTSLAESSTVDNEWCIFERGLQYTQNHQFLLARNEFVKAMHSRSNSLGPTHEYLAPVYEMLGHVEKGMGNNEVALSHYIAALRILDLKVKNSNDGAQPSSRRSSGIGESCTLADHEVELIATRIRVSLAENADEMEQKKQVETANASTTQRRGTMEQSTGIAPKFPPPPPRKSGPLNNPNLQHNTENNRGRGRLPRRSSLRRLRGSSKATQPTTIKEEEDGIRESFEALWMKLENA